MTRARATLIDDASNESFNDAFFKCDFTSAVINTCMEINQQHLTSIHEEPHSKVYFVKEAC